MKKPLFLSIGFALILSSCGGSVSGGDADTDGSGDIPGDNDTVEIEQDAPAETRAEETVDLPAEVLPDVWEEGPDGPDIVEIVEPPDVSDGMDTAADEDEEETCTGVCECTGSCNCTGTVCSCMSALNCSVVCGEGCSLTCSSAGNCDFTCGESCAVFCTSAGHCDIEAGPGSTITCSGPGGCDVDCSGDCAVSCSGPGPCMLSCPADASCTLEDCMGGATQCMPDNMWVCHTVCP